MDSLPLPMKVLSFSLALFLLAESTAVYANSSRPQGCPHQFSPTTARPLPQKPDPCVDPDEEPFPTNECLVDPVVLTGGKFFLPVTDAVFPRTNRRTRGVLEFYRAYSSQDGFDGVFGDGWSSLLDIQVSAHLDFYLRRFDYHLSPSSSIAVRTEGGNIYYFHMKEKTPQELSPTEPIVFLDGQQEISWFDIPTGAPLRRARLEYKRPSGAIYCFDVTYSVITPVSARLTQIKARNGGVMDVFYDTQGRITAVGDNSGRRLDFVYNTQGKVSRMTDSLGRQWTYAYDAATNLLSVTDWLERRTEYGYNDPTDPHNITSITDPGGYVTRYMYNPRDQVIRQIKPGGHTFTFNYDNLLGTSTMTDPNGRLWSYEYVKIGLATLVVDPEGGVNRYTYHPDFNRMASHTDALGRTTRYEYDDDQNLIKVIRADEGEVRYAYDAKFKYKWVSMTDPAGNVTSRTLDASGNTATLTDAAGNTTTFTHTSKGDVSQRRDALGRSESFAYDGGGRLLSATNADGHTRSYGYDARGLLTSATDEGGRQTRYTYDSALRLRAVLLPDGSQTQYTYDVLSRIRSYTNPLGHKTSFSYDGPLDIWDPGCSSCSDQAAATALPTTVTDALGHSTAFIYDALGNLSSVTDANGNTTGFIRDSYGRVTRLSDALGRSIAFTYDPSGNLTRTRDANGRETVFEYDPLDRVTQITDAMSGRTRLEYNLAGALVRVVDPNGRAVTFDRDALSRVVSERDALGNRTAFQYDPVSNLIRRTDALGRTTDYTYDVLDRLSARSYPGGVTERFTYDVPGNLILMQDGIGTTRFVYDAMDRLTRLTYPGNKVLSYTYDPAGNRTSVTSPAGTVTYTYDELSRVKTVKNPANQLFTFAYDPAGRRTEALYPNTVKASYTYDKADRLTGLAWQRTAAPFNTLAFSNYTYDAVGNRLTMRDSEGTHSYAYDALYRLTSVRFPSGTQTVYSYDPAGNRTFMRQGVSVTSYTYDTANRMLSAGQTQFAYDANGNVLSETSAASQRTFSYDFENRLKSVKQGTAALGTYAYDALGRRFEKKASAQTTRYYHDGWSVLFETDQNGAVNKSYILGPRLDEILQSGTQSYLYDGLGSVTGLANPSLVKSATYGYDVYGALRFSSATAADSNNYLYTGRELDRESSLYNNRHRYYYPSIGRFLTKDPIGVRGGVNYYSYVSNNPTNLIDPYGLRNWGNVKNWAPRYGNWGGNDWSGGEEIIPGNLGNINVPCINSLDCLYKIHDLETYCGNTRANKNLLSGLRNLPFNSNDWWWNPLHFPSGPSFQDQMGGDIHRGLATTYFGLVVEAEVN